MDNNSPTTPEDVSSLTVKTVKPDLVEKIGKTTFVINVKQSEKAAKPIESLFRSFCIREAMGCSSPENEDITNNLEKLSKTS